MTTTQKSVTREPEVRGNWLLDLNPFTQGAIAGTLMLAGLLFDWKVTIGTTIICFALAAYAGKLKPFFQIWWKTVLILCIIILVLQTFFIPGETAIFSWWIFTATEEGLAKGIGFASRVLGVGSAIILLVQMMNMTRMVLALEKRKYSPNLTYVITATVNIIPQMRKQMTVIMDAQRARGIETDANLFVRAKAFVPTIGPLILTSIVGVEEKALTLESRGFTAKGERTSIHDINDPSSEKLLRRLLGVACIVLVIGRIVLWVL
ncbi:MAG: energy-coupling factor transporter transmembrane component T [Actinomycetaceae bacterium]|nr:energy-coupling factor transporter transmembrane component T [Actinomycetaceae bacterium]